MLAVENRQSRDHMGIVRNYGFMWEREKVNWGRPNVMGTLMGRKVKKRDLIVDFRDQLGIYVLYDRFESPVQVGQAKNIFIRLRQHQRDHLRNRWSAFSWFGFHPVDEEQKALVKKDVVARVEFQDAMDESKLF